MTLIHEVKRGDRNKRDIAAEFGIPPSTLLTIMKSKTKILAYQAGEE